MALSLGWKANDIRESIWMKDPALRQPLPDGVLDMWREDGDAGHLEPYVANGTPTIIEWRPLNSDEKQVVLGPWNSAETNEVGVNRAWLRCFRIAVRFKDTEEKAVTPDGTKHRVVAKDASGVPMLAMGLVDDIADHYPGLIQFYGSLVFNASFLSDAEKKSIIAAVHSDAITGGGIHRGHYGAVSSCGGCDGCPVMMREQWACPDLGIKKPPGLYNMIPGSDQEFDDCPAYYLRTGSERPAEHLIDGVTHPAHLVGEWAFEVESGARRIDSLSLKAREAVHLYVNEKTARDRYADTLRRAKK